jgi:hypothetical protein
VYVQRSLSAILLLVAGVLLSIGTGSWWLQRTVFTPGASVDIAEAILDDAGIRLEIITVVSARTAGTLEADPTDLAGFLDTSVLSTTPGAAVMAEPLQRAHLRLIGSNDDLVVIVPTELVQIVRDERALDSAPATIPVPVIGTLKTTRTASGWVMLISSGLGVLALLAALATRPYRGELQRGLGEFMIATAVAVLTIGWALPKFVIPAVDSNTWTGAIPHLADRNLGVVMGGSLVLVVGGLLLVLAGVNSTRRGPRVQPAPTMRYRPDTGWG